MKELKDYVGALKLAKTADGTIVNYLHNIGMFLDFTGTNSLEELEALTPADYRSFVLSMLEDRKSSTVNNMIRSINAFLNWMLDEGVMVNDSLPEMNFGGRRSKFLKQDKPVDKYIPDEVAQAMQDACERPDEEIMIALLRHSGMRAGELASVKVSDIKVYTRDDGSEGRRIHLTHTKGDKERFIPIPEHFVNAIFDYVKTRKHDSEYLFIGLGTHEKMSTNAVYARVKRIAELAVGDEEILSKISPHSFRHTAATNWLKQGNTVEQVGAALGHGKNSSQVTTRYTHLTGQMVDKTFDSQNIRV